MWVPLVENGESNSVGADYFIKQHIDNLLQQSPSIDTILLGCTHYPLLIDKIRKFLPAHIQVVSQGEIVAQSLKNYLDRHPAIESRCSKNSQRVFHTTDSVVNFDKQSTLFFGQSIQSQQVVLF
jgi:glutamate racemase